MEQYLKLVKHIRDNGNYKGDRTGTGTLSVFGYQMRFDISNGKFPLVTAKHTHLKSIIHELLWFLQGETNIRYLKENGVRIWDEWSLKESEFGESFDERKLVYVEPRVIPYSDYYNPVYDTEVPSELGSKLRATWYNMINRCYNSEAHNYKYYGAVGVFVCERWHSYKNFVEDVQRLPNWKHKCDNWNDYNLDKDYYSSNCYSPETCLWLSKVENAMYGDCTTLIAITPEGHVEIYPSVNQAAKELDIKRNTLHRFGQRVPDILKGRNKVLKGWRFILLDAPFRYDFPKVGDLGPVYGAQWTNWGGGQITSTTVLDLIEKCNGDDVALATELINLFKNREKNGINQIANLIEMLKKNPDSRRAIVSAWNPAEVDNMALPPCFSAGTLVATPNGYRAIETLQEGEEVISATGIPRRINKVWVTPYSGTVYSLKVRCVGPAIHCTPNHPFFIKDKGWVEAKDIQLGDLMGIPKTKSFRNHSFEVSINHNKGGKIHKRIDLTIDDYYTLGYFMGNGWASVTGNRISFAIPHSKLEEILPRIRKTIKVSKKPGVGENVSTYETKSDTWIPLFREFGHRAHGKKIPQWVMESTKDAKESFLEGFFDADGHFPYFGKVNVTTVSESIAYGVQRLLAEFDLNASVKFQKKKPTHVIEDRTVNQRDLWYLEGHIPLNRSGVVHGEEYLWVPVKDIEEHQTEEIVYNLDVDEEHTYIVQNLATHNCHTMFQFYSNFLSLDELVDVIYKAGKKSEYLQSVRTTELETDDAIYDHALLFCQEHDLPRRKLSCQLYQRKHHCAF